MTSLTPFKTIDERTETAPCHPGEILREDFLAHMKLNGSELARHIDVPASIVDAVLAERAPVTLDLAMRFAAAFRQTPHYWLALQMQYDLWSAETSTANVRPIVCRPTSHKHSATVQRPF